MVNLIQEYLKEITTAMPITTFQKVGNFDIPHSFTDSDDLKLLNSEKAVQKTKEKFSKTKYNFDFYFVNINKNHIDYVETGEVDLDFLQTHMPDFCDWMSKNSKTFNPKAITIIYTNNVGDNKIPMTSWIIAHRMAHAFTTTIDNEFEYDKFIYRLGNIICNVYDMKLVKDAQSFFILDKFTSQIGTFRSARENKIVSAYEFLFECFAQLLLIGKIKFDVPKKPVDLGYNMPVEKINKDGSKDKVKIKHLPALNEAQQMLIYEKLQQFFLDYEAFCNKQLGMAVGKIFVM